jgi:hypothetical protein
MIDLSQFQPDDLDTLFADHKNDIKNDVGIDTKIKQHKKRLVLSIAAFMMLLNLLMLQYNI